MEGMGGEGGVREMQKPTNDCPPARNGPRLAARVPRGKRVRGLGLHAAHDPPRAGDGVGVPIVLDCAELSATVSVSVRARNRVVGSLRDVCVWCLSCLVSYSLGSARTAYPGQNGPRRAGASN